MKKTSIKLRITAWYTVLMTAMAAVALGFLVVISSTVATRTVMEGLSLRRSGAIWTRWLCGMESWSWRSRSTF